MLTQLSTYNLTVNVWIVNKLFNTKCLCVDKDDECKSSVAQKVLMIAIL